MAQKRVLEGFYFSTEADYQDGLREQKAVAYLRKQISGKTPKDILAIYNQILDQDLFSTPIGYAFLHELNLALHRQTTIKDDDIRPIIIKKHDIPAQKVSGQVHDVGIINKKLAQKVRSMRIMVIIFAAIVVAMFVITLTGTTPTILDYETKLQDKYASWEQSLSEREDAVREKEKQLENID